MALEWQWLKFSTGSKFGTGCAYFPDAERQAELEAQGYRFFGGHTFKYFGEAMTEDDAEAFCEDLGGHLATSTSAEKNTFLGDLINEVDSNYGDTWQWVTGEGWNYTNWGNNYNHNPPSYYPSTNSKLYLFFWTSNYAWDDKDTVTSSWNLSFIHSFASGTMTCERLTGISSTLASWL